MEKSFAIKADITRSHKETLGFEYETRLVCGAFPWGKYKHAYYVSTDSDELPKKFASEESANKFIKTLKTYSQTDKHIKIIEFSIVYYK
jgi:hypothetical protein